jgi:hypothetical protein
MTEIWDTRTGRFDVLPAGERAEVIDTVTGRPVGIFDSRTSAMDEALALNNAVLAGPKHLARALGAIEDDEVLL